MNMFKSILNLVRKFTKYQVDSLPSHQEGLQKNPNVFLIRRNTSDQGTLGNLIFEGYSFECIELPWRDNQTNISCIPVGIYKMVRKLSPKYGECFELTDVQGRTFILAHWGNVAGDKEKGYKTHSAGCILLGLNVGKLYGQDAVLNSRLAFRKLMNLASKKEYTIMVTEIWNG